MLISILCFLFSLACVLFAGSKMRSAKPTFWMLFLFTIIAMCFGMNTLILVIKIILL